MSLRIKRPLDLSVLFSTLLTSHVAEIYAKLQVKISTRQLSISTVTAAWSIRASLLILRSY